MGFDLKMSRLFATAACLILPGIAAEAQVIPAAPREGKPPIELKLSTTTMMPCVGSSIPLDLELTNRGNDDFKIDKYDIWNQFQYAFWGERNEGRGGGMGTSCDSCRGQFLILKPDQSYESSFKFDFENHRDFFKDAGKYIIKRTIAGVPSNELEFELVSCSSSRS